MESTDKAVEVYQLRIWIRRVSPQIWRRLLVRSDSTMAELHDILQIVFGWTDDHLLQHGIEKGRRSCRRNANSLSFALSHDFGSRLARPVERMRLSIPFGDICHEPFSQVIQGSEVTD